MRLIFCFSRSCFEYSDALRRRAWFCPCWPGAYGRRSTGHFSVKHLVPFRKSLVPSRRHCRQLGPVYRAIAQTLRRFGGRQPLCGIGVTSLIDRICSPAAASAWIADSRPLPGPCTRTSTRLDFFVVPDFAVAMMLCSWEILRRLAPQETQVTLRVTWSPSSCPRSRD